MTTVKHYGKKFNCHVFTTVEHTNEWLFQNEDWGVLTVDSNGLIYVAHIKDNGE